MISLNIQAESTVDLHNILRGILQGSGADVPAAAAPTPKPPKAAPQAAAPAPAGQPAVVPPPAAAPAANPDVAAVPVTYDMIMVLTPQKAKECGRAKVMELLEKHGSPGNAKGLKPEQYAAFYAELSALTA